MSSFTSCFAKQSAAALQQAPCVTRGQSASNEPKRECYFWTPLYLYIQLHVLLCGCHFGYFSQGSINFQTTDTIHHLIYLYQSVNWYLIWGEKSFSAVWCWLSSAWQVDTVLMRRKSVKRILVRDMFCPLLYHRLSLWPLASFSGPELPSLSPSPPPFYNPLLQPSSMASIRYKDLGEFTL